MVKIRFRSESYVLSLSYFFNHADVFVLFVFRSDVSKDLLAQLISAYIIAPSPIVLGVLVVEESWPLSSDTASSLAWVIFNLKVWDESLNLFGKLFRCEADTS